MSSRPRWRRRALVALVLLGLLLAGLEAGLRLRGFAGRAAIWYDPAVGFRNQPHQTRWMIGPKGEQLAKLSTNALGFRGPLPDRERTPGVPRVLTLGDSFTFSLGVPEGATFPALLQQELADLPGPPEVMDLSFPGWAPANELAAYRELGRPYAPDVVVLGFTLDDLKPKDQGVRYTDNWAFRLLGRTALLEAVQRNVLVRLDDYVIERSPEEQHLREEYDKRPLAIQGFPKEPYAKVHWDRVAGELAQLRDACAEDGARLLVVAFPSGPQVRRLRKAPEGPEREAVRAKECAYQVELAERCAALGIELHDIQEDFVQAEGNPMGREDPSHPSAQGYGIMARAVARRLMELGWLGA